MTVYRFTLEGHDFETEIIRRDGHEVVVAVNGKEYVATVQPRWTDLSEDRPLPPPVAPAPPPPVQKPRKPARPAHGGVGVVTAPLPGLLLRIPVTLGDRVRRGQTVAVIEAMKMEIRLTSPRAAAKNKYSQPIKSPKARTEAQACPAANERQAWVRADWQFSDAERGQIRQYVQGYSGKGRGKSKNLPPGLAKKVARGESLPPGWQKKCQVGQPMPAEVYEHCRPLPPELVVKLPPAPEPTITVAIGGKVVRLLQATREILDVFDVRVRL